MKTTFCIYPKCNCPFDAPADPNWCARGLPHKTNEEAMPAIDWGNIDSVNERAEDDVSKAYADGRAEQYADDLAQIDAMQADIDRLRNHMRLINSLYSDSKSMFELANDMYQVKCISAAALSEEAKGTT